MNESVEKALKQFSQYRDWLLIALFGIGVFFFMQRGQAVQQQDPEDIWRGIYGDVVVHVPPTGGAGMGAGGQTTPESAQGNAGMERPEDLFSPVPLQEIEAISINPVFTPADQYTKIRDRLVEIQKEFKLANEQGDTKTAIEKLRIYCKDDPKGILLEWGTEPQSILKNLVCEQFDREIDSTIRESEALRDGASQLETSDPAKSIENLDQAIALLDRILASAKENTLCLTEITASESKVSSAQSMRDDLVRRREGMNEKALRQQFETVVRMASAIDVNSPPETVAQSIQALESFNDTLAVRDPEKKILSSAQLQELENIRAKVESNKESLMTQVRQRVAQLEGELGSLEETDPKRRDLLNNILEQFDVLKFLGDSKAQTDRRKYESMLGRLEASESVAKMQALIQELETQLNSIETKLQGGEDVADLQKAIEANFELMNQEQKNRGVRTVPEYNDVSREHQKQKRRWNQILQRIRK